MPSLDGVIGVVWIAYDDACPLCQSAHGEEFSIASLPSMAPGDMHPGCVCYWGEIYEGETFNPTDGREFDERWKAKVAEFLGSHPPVTAAHLDYTAQMFRLMEMDPLAYFDADPEDLIGNESWLLGGLLLAGAIETQIKREPEPVDVTHEEWGY